MSADSERRQDSSPSKIFFDNLILSISKDLNRQYEVSLQTLFTEYVDTDEVNNAFSMVHKVLKAFRIPTTMEATAILDEKYHHFFEENVFHEDVFIALLAEGYIFDPCGLGRLFFMYKVFRHIIDRSELMKTNIKTTNLILVQKISTSILIIDNPKKRYILTASFLGEIKLSPLLASDFFMDNLRKDNRVRIIKVLINSQ